jgi:hypothetical protein
MASDSPSRGTASPGYGMNTTQTTIAPAARTGAVPSGLPRRLLAAIWATVLAGWATSAPGVAEWESRVLAGARFDGPSPIAIIVLLALLPAWLPLDRVIAAGLQLYARIGIGPGGRRPAGSEAGLRVGHLRRVAPVREAAFRVHGCLAGVALGIMVAGSTQASLADWLFGTRFEGGASVLGAMLGMLSGTCVILALVAAPRLATRWRIEGPVGAGPSMQVMQYGADLPFLMLVIYVVGYWIGWEAAPSLLVLPLVTLAALTGYALPQLLWREKSGNPQGVWIVLLQPDDSGAEHTERALRQIDMLARTWVHGPMTVVLDASLDIGGEQLHAALALGRERAMFPRIEVELADWGMLLPPSERWSASPMRELHVPSELMLPALERFAGTADLVILVSRQVEPIHTWRKRFRQAEILVAWDGGGNGPAGAIALDSLGELLVRWPADSLGAPLAASLAATIATGLTRQAARESTSAPAVAARARAVEEPVKQAASEPGTGSGSMDKTSVQKAEMEPDALLQRLFETCVLLGEEGTIRGTGFVVARGFAATADHLLRDHAIGESFPVQVGWRGFRRTSIATIYRRDPASDVALLSLQHCDDIAPFSFRTDAAPGDTWMTFGFHLPEYADGPGSKRLNGSIVSSDALSPNGSPRLALMCEERVPPGGLAGLSGSPVVVGGALAAVIVGTTGNTDDQALMYLSGSPIGNLIALLDPGAAGSQPAPHT